MTPREQDSRTYSCVLTRLADIDVCFRLRGPQYIGRLTFKGEVRPSESTIVTAKLSARNAGSYALDSWSVATDVLEPQKDEHERPYVVRQRYEQVPQAGDNASVTIVDKSST